MHWVSSVFISLHRFNIVSNLWKRFHMLVESYVQKK